MTETMLGLVPIYGPLAVFAATILSCFGVPVPGALVLLAAGSFVASGELALVAVLFGGLAGAIIGDQAGYLLEPTVVRASFFGCHDATSSRQPWAPQGHLYFAGVD
jgi:hypothetical protein